jgi:predicted PurR-regulated permease PerM
LPTRLDALASTRRIEWIAAIVVLMLLVAGCVLVLRPFSNAVLWAMVLTFSTWPLYARLEPRVGHKRWLAALLMTLLLAAAFVAPLAFLSTTLARHATRAIDLVRSLLSQGPPAPPAWVARLPVVGEDLARTWSEFATDSDSFSAAVTPYLLMLRGWAITSGLALGSGVLELTIGLLVAFFFYRDGHAVVEQANLLGHRLVGDRVQHLFEVAGSTVRGVVYGIVGTALIQGVLAAVGLWLAGVPGAVFLAFVTFFLAFVPSGPLLVWVPVAVWLASSGEIGRFVFICVWSFVIVNSIDHLLKPVLISRESNMPLLIVFFGVVGGALAFGIIGIFLGPTLLAVSFALLRDWVTLVRAEERVAATAPVVPAPVKAPGEPERV